MIIACTWQAVAPLGAILGGGMAGWTSEGLGRKPTIVLACVPNIVGWLLLASANCLHSTGAVFKTIIFTGRFFTGVAMGWSMLISPVSTILHQFMFNTVHYLFGRCI